MPNLNNDGSNTDIKNNFNNGLEDDKNSLEKTSVRDTIENMNEETHSQNIKDNLSNNVNSKLNAVGNQVAISLHNQRDISEDAIQKNNNFAKMLNDGVGINFVSNLDISLCKRNGLEETLRTIKEH